MVDCYIEIIRNTLFLVQIFFILFGLPAAGLRLSPNAAALLAMVINVGAYATEIIRAGIESIRKGQVEAGLALLGVKPLQVLWAPAPVVMVTLRRGTDVIAHHVPVPHQGRPAQERGWLARRTLPAVPPN